MSDGEMLHCLKAKLLDPFHPMTRNNHAKRALLNTIYSSGVHETSNSATLHLAPSPLLQRVSALSVALTLHDDYRYP